MHHRHKIKDLDKILELNAVLLTFSNKTERPFNFGKKTSKGLWKKTSCNGDFSWHFLFGTFFIFGDLTFELSQQKTTCNVKLQTSIALYLGNSEPLSSGWPRGWRCGLSLSRTSRILISSPRIFWPLLFLRQTASPGPAHQAASEWNRQLTHAWEAGLKLPSVLRCLSCKTASILPKLPYCCRALPKLQKVSWFDIKVIACVHNKNKSMWQILMKIWLANFLRGVLI